MEECRYANKHILLRNRGYEKTEEGAIDWFRRMSPRILNRDYTEAQDCVPGHQVIG